MIKNLNNLNNLRGVVLAAATAGLVAAVGLGVYVPLAEATFPGTPGRIAYTFYKENVDHTEIYTMKASGEGKVQVTGTLSGAIDPSYSPSGSRIAYSGDDGNDFEIYTIKASGGGKVQVTDNTFIPNATTAEDRSPSYSPNGERIAYTFDDGPDAADDSEIYTIPVNGGRRVQVTDNTAGDYDPSYSPNGERIAYTFYDGNQADIYTIRPDGSGKHQVTDTPRSESTPDYAPYGKRIAYVSDDGIDPDIYTIRPDGSGKHRLTDNNIFEANPSYSPSGNRIAYDVHIFGSTPVGSLYTIRADGGGKHKVTDNTTLGNPTWGSR